MNAEPVELAKYLDALPVRRRVVWLRAAEELTIPAFGGDLWHSVLGAALKKRVCTVPPGVCAGCRRVRSCEYPTVFESAPLEREVAPLAGLARIPGPVVFDTAPWRSRLVRAGERFGIAVTIVSRHLGLAEVVTEALADAGRRGLGRFRRPAHYDGHDETVGLGVEPIGEARECVRLRLLTPLRLKRGGTYCREFDLNAFARDLAFRIAALGHYHGGLAWPAPWAELASGVAGAKVAESALWWIDARRYSARQRRQFTLGGLVGDVVLDEVDPALRLLLQAGTVLHSGKAASLGFGQIEVVPAGAERKEE